LLSIYDWESECHAVSIGEYKAKVIHMEESQGRC
jgi:hypothetical protein